MAFEWAIVVGLLSLATCWGVALYVYRTRPRDAQNRRLARALIFLGIYVAILPPMVEEAFDTSEENELGGAISAALGAVILLILGVLAFGISILLVMTNLLGLVATLDTPMARPFRRFAVRFLTNIGLLLGFFAALAVIPVDHGASAMIVIMAMPAYSLIAAISAFRRAKPGREESARARAFAVAFGVLAMALIILCVATALAAAFEDVDAILAGIALVYWPVSAIVVAVVSGYGQLRPQKFDLDLKVKIGIKRSTLYGMFFAAAFAAFELLQQSLGELMGVAGAIVAAGLLFPFRARLDGWAERVSSKALPKVEDTPEYRAMKKLGVYRSAVETALRNGVTEEERALLGALEGELELAPDIASQIQREALGKRVQAVTV